MERMSVRDVIIVGAGPSGLSAAIAAKQRGLDYAVLEQGTLVNSIYRFPPQMVFFTTPELLEIGGVPFVSPYDKPTRAEALRYYRKVVGAFDLQVAFDERVTAITPEPDEARAAGEPTLFSVETMSSRGVRRPRLARHVVMAIGYFDHPVLLNVPGEDLPHVHHYYGEPHPYYRQRVVVVGGGNSAAESALELFRAGAHVTLVHRGPELKPTIKYWVRPDIENRIKEGSVIARFNSSISEIRPRTVVIAPYAPPEGDLAPSGESAPASGEAPVEADAHERVAQQYHRQQAASAASAAREELPADAVFLLTGYRADTQLLVDAGVTLTARNAPVHDPATFESSVPGLFVAGGALAGIDTGTIFIENGRFHGEKIIEAIASRCGQV
jgi:thioredoxin reductase (NADPH)